MKRLIIAAVFLAAPAAATAQECELDCDQPQANGLVFSEQAFAPVTELGAVNIAAVQQQGENHRARIDQRGVGNSLVLRQVGSDHIANVYQRNNSLNRINAAELTQTGHDNRIDVGAPLAPVEGVQFSVIQDGSGLGLDLDQAPGGLPSGIRITQSGTGSGAPVQVTVGQ